MTPEDVRPSASWVFQAVTGGALLVLLTVHMIAHHFVVEDIGGLRDYAKVLEYVSNPLIVGIEIVFLGTVTWHAMLGLRAVLLDFGGSRRFERSVNRGVTILGIATITYGLWLIGTLASRA
jgi:succinate dehydrogenase hydrophobic anchor subunit